MNIYMMKFRERAREEKQFNKRKRNDDLSFNPIRIMNRNVC